MLSAEASFVTNPPVYYGYTYNGEGIYLSNVKDPTTTNAAYVMVDGIGTSAVINVTMLNGYDHEVLLRSEYGGWSPLLVRDVRYYDDMDNEQKSQTWMAINPAGSPRRLFERYQPLPALENHNGKRMSILGGAPTSASVHVPLEPSTNTTRIVITVEACLEYYIVGETNFYTVTTPMEARLTKPIHGQPSAAASPSVGKQKVDGQ